MSEEKGDLATRRRGGDFFIIRVAGFVCGGEICILSESSGAKRRRKEGRLRSVEYEFAMGVGDDDAARAMLPSSKKMCTRNSFFGGAK